MRLRSLTLFRYGNYEAERICFDVRPGTVNVLMAPNSAGKSVLRNAFADLLFGIHNQTPMGFRFGYPGMRVAADIVRSDGSSLSFNRRKARGNTITDDDGRPVDMSQLHGILGGRDRALLERLFVLDTEALRGGGKALLETGGDVASALLSAAGGIRQARALKQRLEQQRDGLAPGRKTAARPFYGALDKFLEARRAASSAAIRPDEWASQERALKALEDKQRASNIAVETASMEISRLERNRRVRPALARHVEAVAWLTAHPDAPRLSPDLARTFPAARQKTVTSRDVAERAGVALAKAEHEAAEIDVDAELLARAEQIERLSGQAGAARKARDDLPAVHGQHAHGLTRIRDLLRQLGSPLAPDRAADLLPETAVVARTRGLIDRHAEIVSSIRNADAQIESLGRDTIQIERRLGELPPPPDLFPLETLLDTIRADGDPAVRLSDAERLLQEAETALNAACRLVPGETGDAAKLAATRPLTVDIYSRHEKELAAARNGCITEEQRHDDESDRLTQARAGLRDIADRGVIPDEVTLADVRARRDGLWRLIYRRAFTGEAADPAEEQSRTSGMPLPLAFERSISEADAIADRRYTESELLARIATARQAVAQAERRTGAAAQRVRLAEEKLSQLRRAWTQMCTPLGLGDEPTLADIQAFLSARERVIDALRRRDVAAGGLEALRRKQAEWEAALAGRLIREKAGLPSLLAVADRTLAQARAHREERLQLEAKQTQFDDQAQAVRAMRAAQDAKLETWREQWLAAMTILARPATEEPLVTAAVLETLREIATEHRAAVSLQERIEGMQAEIERFTRAVQTLAGALPGLSADPFEAARELARSLNQQRILHQQRHKAVERLDLAKAEHLAAETAVLAAATTLHGLLDLIGADDIEAAERLLELSAERARHEAQERAASTELLESGDGFSIDQLRTEVEANAPDEIPARIDAAAAARKAASDAAQQCAEEASALRHRMEHDAIDTKVNAAAADQQSAIASLSRTLDEALLYHTASVLLGRALEAIEKSGDSKMLRRLSAIFEMMTGGAYAQLVTEMDDGGTARLGLVQRDYPEERQSIDQLSEGTRDQLFLALRVAAIEDHLTTAKPLPFIGDDILQTFDDDRALAALRVLLELSKHTQIIILTHHRHILELAARLPEGSLFPCRREPMEVTA